LQSSKQATAANLSS